MPWLTDLEVTDADGEPGMWVLLNSLCWVDPRGALWVVPTGFVSDFASVPRIFWALYPPTVSRKACWIHDWVYVYQPDGVTREDADRLLLEGMIEEGLPVYRARIIWAAVRAGGWLPWKRRGAARNKNGKGASA